MSQTWQGRLSGKPSGDPTSALPSGKQSAATIAAKVCAQRFQLHCARVAETRQEVSFCRTASTVLATKDWQTCIFQVAVLQTLPSPVTDGPILCDTGSSFPGTQGGGLQGTHTEIPFALPFPATQMCVLIAGQVG